MKKRSVGEGGFRREKRSSYDDNNCGGEEGTSASPIERLVHWADPVMSGVTTSSSWEERETRGELNSLLEVAGMGTN
jgi:hypothetical protein